MLPSGTDQAFVWHTPIGVGDAVLISQCRAEPSCKALFDAQLAAVHDLAKTLEWDTMINQAGSAIAPYLERDVRSEITPDAVAAAVQAVRDFLVARATEVEAYLTPPVPAPPVAQNPVVQNPVSNGAVETAAAKPRCVVPKLSGATLAQARRRLARAHCSLGKVTRSKRARQTARYRLHASGGHALPRRHEGQPHAPGPAVGATITPWRRDC